MAANGRSRGSAGLPRDLNVARKLGAMQYVFEAALVCFY